MSESPDEGAAGNPKGHSVDADWVREDALHHDPLLDCLVELTRIHGRPSNRAALSAGLPLVKNLLTPSLFSRAAARAGRSTPAASC